MKDRMEGNDEQLNDEQQNVEQLKNRREYFIYHCQKKERQKQSVHSKYTHFHKQEGYKY